MHDLVVPRRELEVELLQILQHALHRRERGQALPVARSRIRQGRASRARRSGALSIPPSLALALTFTLMVARRLRARAVRQAQCADRAPAAHDAEERADGARVRAERGEGTRGELRVLRRAVVRAVRGERRAALQEREERRLREAVPAVPERVDVPVQVRLHGPSRRRPVVVVRRRRGHLPPWLVPALDVETLQVRRWRMRRREEYVAGGPDCGGWREGGRVARAEDGLEDLRGGVDDERVQVGRAREAEECVRVVARAAVAEKLVLEPAEVAHREVRDRQGGRVEDVQEPAELDAALLDAQRAEQREVVDELEVPVPELQVREGHGRQLFEG